MEQLGEEAKDKFYGPLSMFGEELLDGPEQDEGDLSLQVTRILPTLIQLSNFLQRSYAVVKNLVQQLASLYHDRQRLYISSFRYVQLGHPFKRLARFFQVLITLDEIVIQNAAFANAWTAYKRLLKTVKLDPTRYGTDDDRLTRFEKQFLELEGELLDGLIFQNCVEQDFDFSGVVEVKNNHAFKSLFTQSLRRYYESWCQKFADFHETDQRYEFVGILGLYTLYFYIFRDNGDKKFFKSLWDTHRKLPIVLLYGTTVWLPADFLAKRLPSLAKAMGHTDLTGFRRECSKQTDNYLSRDVQYFHLEVCTWMVRMESDLAISAPLRDVLNTRVSLFINGLTLAYQIGNLLKTALNLHLVLNEPLKQGLVRHMGRLAELLKAIEITYHRKCDQVAETLPHMTRLLAFNIQRILQPVSARMRQAKRFDDAKLDSLAAMGLVSTLLNGPATPDRRLLIHIAFNVANSKGNFKDEESEEIGRLMWKLDLIADLSKHLHTACDTSFLYWSRQLIPIQFAGIYQAPKDAQRLQYVLSALRDPLALLRSQVHIEDQEAFVKSYKAEVEDALNEEIIRPLCRDIETDLRLHIHSAVHRDTQQAPNPFKEKLKDLARFLKIKPLRLFDSTVDLNAHVAHYLDTTFYNLTTVALHDWKSYGEMRNLAAQKYGLLLTESHLPSQTLEQGLDVLEIMRNIHIFVAKYNYNLNSQVFVERSADAKHLNTISIRHIANSIRTHGTGVMNTAVNFTYQFLLQKFRIFSQFLYDDHIKSRLIKDIRYYKENREKLNNMYPYDRAEKFHKDIRKLGVNKDGSSYLDRFRQLITEIGNALGYVRMVRSGGVHYLSNAIKFVPDLREIIEFEELAAKESLSVETVEACKNLDAVIENLSSKFAEGTDYFQVLVEVFAEGMRSDQNKHLSNFHAIVPPLAINFVEHIMSLKDKMSKKGKEASFTDDGFAIGLAYILKLLNLNTQYDSLHWFESVVQKFKEEDKKLKGVMSTKKRQADNELQTLQLTQRRLESYQLEFDLLYYSFSGARVFFKDAK
eukprot:TRINITY_DN1931_c0_g1_i1.p1 TRINITY_DN1931_c0_g1~~TRINITY_DN1931_c0_g1_i1.p1  ORF type:complete len:1034 (-),score=307.02 TRINITY_DN1931_c0_g1_i1:86-3187(-)